MTCGRSRAGKSQEPTGKFSPPDHLPEGVSMLWSGRGGLTTASSARDAGVGFSGAAIDVAPELGESFQHPSVCAADAPAAPRFQHGTMMNPIVSIDWLAAPLICASTAGAVYQLVAARAVRRFAARTAID